MRIVAGEWRGRAIDAPQGKETRPTTDRVREALFSSLYSVRGGFDEAVVLDAFAGSGALGLEALSRGARFALFYESDATAAEVCRRNMKKLGLETGQATCVQRDVMKAPLEAQNHVFDLVFFDPPYRFDPFDILKFARSLVDRGAASRDALFVYEHAHNSTREAESAACDAGFAVLQQKKYGKTGVTIFRQEG